MNPSHAESADDVVETSLDLPLFMTDKVVKEVHDGRPELVGNQKRHADVLKAGGKSGITRDFGKMAIDDPVARKGTTAGADVSRTAAASDEVCEAEAKSGESLPPDVAELLVRVLSSPEFESLLDQPVPTMLWTPETAGKVSDELSGACMSFRVADPELAGSPTAPQADRETLQPRESSDAAVPHPGDRSVAKRSDVVSQRHQSLLQDPGVDQTSWAKRLELRLLLERPGKPTDVPEKESSEEKSVWTARPRIKRTLERPAILADLIEKETLEKQSWAKPPKLRGTLERPAVLEDIIQKEAERQSWAKRPKLRATLEHPGNLDDIMRDARALFLANLTAASTLYGRDDHTGGDAAVDKAIFQLVRPGGMTESGVAIAPIILATIDGILFEYGKSSADAGEGSAPGDAASERRPLSMNLAQFAQMNILAANAASASARLVAESGRALVKAEEMSNLTTGVLAMVKDAISNRANSIQHASIALLARAAARDDCTEQLVTLIKQNVREAIETESRQTLKQTIRSVSGAQEQRIAGDRYAREGALVSGRQSAERSKDEQDELTGGGGSGGGAGSAAKHDDVVQAKDSSEADVRSFDQQKIGALPALDAAIVAAASAETKRRPQTKKDEVEIDPVVKKQVGLEFGGSAAGEERLLVPGDATGALTIRMLGRSGPDMAQLGELLASALSKRAFLARLTAACNALRSERESAARCTTFDITLDGFGTGETVLVVLAKDQVEALRLQAQMSPHMAEGHNLTATVEGAHHLCDGAATAPIDVVVTPNAVAPAPHGPEQPSLRSTQKADHPEPGDSAWDAFATGCKLAVNRLFGKK